MALIKCPECGKEISDKATACPNCGYPIDGKCRSVWKRPKRPWTWRGCWWRATAPPQDKNRTKKEKLP